MSTPMVRLIAAKGAEKLVRESGANPMAVLGKVGLSDSQLHDPNTYVAYVKFAELLGECADACDEPCFGLLLAQRQSIEVLGDLPLIAARAQTVGDAVQTLDRYLYLHAASVRLECKPAGDDVTVSLRIEIGSPFGFEQVMQLSVVHLAMFFSAVLGRELHQLPMTLKQPAPARSRDALKFRRITFSAPYDGISLPATDLKRPNRQNEAALTHHLQTYLTQLQALYPDRLTDQVKDLISRLLPSGECSVERVASTLDLHTRSLQEKLKEQGTSYRELLQDVRKGLAIQQLNQRDVSVTDLALQLGYAEVAVFSRHFKQWTGLSPRAWRRAHQRQAGVVEWLR